MHNKIICVSDVQIDKLMELDIMKALIEMEFPIEVIRRSLKEKIVNTGLPFFDMEKCVESVMITEGVMMDEVYTQHRNPFRSVG